MQKNPLTDTMLDTIIIQEYTARHPIVGFFICLAIVVVLLVAFL